MIHIFRATYRGLFGKHGKGPDLTARHNTKVNRKRHGIVQNGMGYLGSIYE